MQEVVELSKKNKLVYISSLVGMSLFCALRLYYSNKIPLIFIFFVIFYFAFIGYLMYRKINAKTIQTLLFFGFNTSILLFNLINFQMIDIISFVFLLIIVSFYKSFFITFSVLITSIVEIFFLKIIAYPISSIAHETPYLYMFVVVIFLLCTISGIQTLYINRLWNRVEVVATSKEKEILSREAYLRLFYEHAKDGIAVVDLNDRIIDMNPAFEKLYGWTREESLGQTITLVPPENVGAANDRLNHLLQGDSYPLLETRDMKKDGTLFDAQLSLSPIFNADGEILATSIISRDISYKKETEKLILQSKKLKIAGEIAAGVAHEIRNPITVISGFIQMMNNDKDSPYHSYTTIIQAEIDRINLIIGEFLVLSKPYEENINLFSIESVLMDTYKLFRIEFQRHNIQFTQNLSETNNKVVGTENQLKQVFINIFKNAIESITENQILGEIMLTVERTSELFTQISIRDNGIGMSKEQMKHLFEPFYTTKQKGTGLGMMISNKIIQEHGGIIEICSEENIGTTIIIKLPSKMNP